MGIVDRVLIATAETVSSCIRVAGKCLSLSHQILLTTLTSADAQVYERHRAREAVTARAAEIVRVTIAHLLQEGEIEGVHRDGTKTALLPAAALEVEVNQLMIRTKRDRQQLL